MRFFVWETRYSHYGGESWGRVRLTRQFALLSPSCLSDYQICHLCGQGNLDPALEQTEGYAQFEYVADDLPHLFAAADFIVSRAGATALFEFLSLQKPALLIPLSLQASRGDQIENAEGFSKCRL